MVPKVVAIDLTDGASGGGARRVGVERLGLPWVDEGDTGGAELALVVTLERLELRVLRSEDASLVGGHAVAPAFERLDVTSGPGRSLRQPLLRAVGIRKGDPYRPVVVDATAGLGEDAWLLAGAGCRVVAVERNAVLAALLADAVERAKAFAPEVAGRIAVVSGDAGALLPSLRERQGEESDICTRPDVVYLDPMYPGHTARKTAERKPMRVLRWLVGDDVDADALLGPAMAAARRRVVVKRPMKAEPLAGRTPAVTHEGKGVRYDVYPTG